MTSKDLNGVHSRHKHHMINKDLNGIYSYHEYYMGIKDLNGVNIKSLSVSTAANSIKIYSY
jgi:hypothetical protein